MVGCRVGFFQMARGEGWDGCGGGGKPSGETTWKGKGRGAGTMVRFRAKRVLGSSLTKERNKREEMASDQLPLAAVFRRECGFGSVC